MQSITLHSRVGQDGILRLQIPVGMKDTEMEVVVIVQPVASNGTIKTLDDLGWPPGFFEKTFGSLKDFPEIEYEGDFEVREELP